LVVDGRTPANTEIPSIAEGGLMFIFESKDIFT